MSKSTIKTVSKKIRNDEVDLSNSDEDDVEKSTDKKSKSKSKNTLKSEQIKDVKLSMEGEKTKSSPKTETVKVKTKSKTNTEKNTKAKDISEVDDEVDDSEPEIETEIKSKSKTGTESESETEAEAEAETKSRKKAPKIKTEDKKNKTREKSEFILREIDTMSLDREILPEISKKSRDEDTKSFSTSLEKLGISIKKKPVDTILWGDHYNVNLIVSRGYNDTKFKLDRKKKIKCTHCHQYPPEGALMLAVPYKYVPHYIEEYVYSPECINIVSSINVDNSTVKSDGKKNVPKYNLFKRDIPKTELHKYEKENTIRSSNAEEKAYDEENKNDAEEEKSEDESESEAGNKKKSEKRKNRENSSGRKKGDKLKKRGYFECVKPVCSFNCMAAKGRELSLIDPKFNNVKTFISHLYMEVFGKLPEKITPAPPFDILEEYGGEYTLEEYRRDFKFINVEESNQYFEKAKNVINYSEQIYAFEDRH